jgi:hypothetical protein
MSLIFVLTRAVGVEDYGGFEGFYDYVVADYEGHAVVGVHKAVAVLQLDAVGDVVAFEFAGEHLAAGAGAAGEGFFEGEVLRAD